MSSSAALEAFLAEPRNVIVAGIRKDGRPHRSPNWFLLVFTPSAPPSAWTSMNIG